MQITSEQVMEGHPDKVCDQISDAILDELLKQDERSRAAVETMIAKNTVFIAGEVTSEAKIDIEDITRRKLREIGYTDSKSGIDTENCRIITQIVEQSPDIARGVNKNGAGDQGMMYGYATNETKTMMPISWQLATDICVTLSKKRKNKEIPFLLPDGKAQVTVLYDGNKPIGIDTIVVSAQHTSDVDIETVRKTIRETLRGMIDEKVKLYINPTGRFVVGGPYADTGLTGRKIICDTYGGVARHGGGAFSGKDPSKVDRSAAYMARKIAKDMITEGLAKKCEIQLCYAIGVAEPVAVYANTFGTGDDEEIVREISKRYDLTPNGIIQFLDLRSPIYSQTAAYGHFGKEGLPWER